MNIRVCNICRAFGAKWAANMVSFEVPTGKIYGFIGPNGSGKTTTLRIMAGIDQPQMGDVLYDDLSVVLYPDKARRVIGYMPDSLPNFTDIRVWEYLDFFARSFDIQGQERRDRLAWVEAFTGVESFREKYLNTLSKGMKQRVSLARALVHKPQVLLLDEPAAGLDPVARHDLKVMLKEIAKDGVTILMSSHILPELQDMCDGAVIIKDGFVVASGLMEQLQQQTDFVTQQQEAQQATTATGEAPAPVVTIGIKVRSLGPAEALKEVLAKLPQCVSVEIIGEHEANARLNCGEDGIPQIIWMLLSADIPVVGFEKQEMGLEEMFLKLSK